MYHIRVELAVIHEHLHSHLTHCVQLVKEGKELLADLPEFAAIGVDSMVP